MAKLISGVGRSGTTLLFRVIGNGIVKQYDDAKCIYEPYLWDMPEVQNNADTVDQPFSVGQLSLFNMYVHCNTPLFLRGRNQLHDGWLSKVFNTFGHGHVTAPDGILVKVIRGTGRLEAMLSKISNLKVLIVLRNPVDTINSSLGLFSFFGDEYYKSDKQRFIKEVNDNFGTCLKQEEVRNEIEWGTLWWRYFTEESIRIVRKYPDRVFLLGYEEFIKNRNDKIRDVFSFFNLDLNNIDEELLGENAGPLTEYSFLSTDNIQNLMEQTQWYCANLGEDNRVGFDELWPDLLEKYHHRKFVNSILLTDPADRTTTSWRDQVFHMRLKASGKEAKQPYTADKNINGISLSYVFAEVGVNTVLQKTESAVNRDRVQDRESKGKIGVVITCFNNASTIRECMLSVLSQTKRPDIILVCDDGSQDGSREIIDEFENKYSEVTRIFREETLGVAANRDLAIRDLEADYITTLDGDDIYAPYKIEYESYVLDQVNVPVAFSDIIMLEQERNQYLDTSPYNEQSVENMLKMLAGMEAPIPRDLMLRKSTYINAQGFDVRMEMYEDWALKMRLIADAGDKGWCHSGVVGTIYDRRNPGLSSKPQILHAHARMLVLGRNCDLLKTHGSALVGGLALVAQHLDGELRSRFKNLIESVTDRNSAGEEVSVHLNNFWKHASTDNNPETVHNDINKFLENMGA